MHGAKVKIEVSVLAKKAGRKNGGAAQAIFHLGSRFQWSALCPSVVTPMEKIFSVVANWMGPRAGVNVVEKQKSVVLIRTRAPDCPANKLMAVSWCSLLYCTILKLCRWVKNYPQCRYIFCIWLYCWLGMTRYTWSTPLLSLWCRCDLHSPFLSWVLCHKHGHSQFYLHQRRAEGSDPFLWAEGLPGVKMQGMMSVQYGNSVMSQRIVC